MKTDAHECQHTYAYLKSNSYLKLPEKKSFFDQNLKNKPKLDTTDKQKRFRKGQLGNYLKKSPKTDLLWLEAFICRS